MKSVSNTENRQWNFELLRIIAMCMIIAMHYMTKGMKLPKLSEDLSAGNIFYWILYAFCIVAVNVYVLISGYFLCGNKDKSTIIPSEKEQSGAGSWKISKLITLWLQVFVYSLFVPLILGAFGIVDLGTFNLAIWQQILLPIQYEHYWFATSYIMLYALSPILVLAVNNLEKRAFKAVIVVLLVIFCGFKSINPYLIPWDKYGCDVLWFICLFLAAGYIRKYGIKIFNSLKISVLLYALFSVLTFGIAVAVSLAVRNIGKLEYYMDMTYSYNYVTVFAASVSLFYAVLLWGEKMDEEGIDRNTTPEYARRINYIAAQTFGVYLLHENIVIRNAWQEWLGISFANGKLWQPLHLVFCILVVFTVGTLIEAIRKGIFRAFKRNNLSKSAQNY